MSIYNISLLIIGGLLFYLAAMVIASLVFPWYYRITRGWSLQGLFSARSFSISYLQNVARKQADMTEFFKSFYDMKYQQSVFVIKGIGGMIVLSATTFIEKLVKEEKALTSTDVQLVVITGFMLCLLIYLVYQLQQIAVEYGETLKIYYAYRR